MKEINLLSICMYIVGNDKSGSRLINKPSLIKTFLEKSSGKIVLNPLLN